MNKILNCAVDSCKKVCDNAKHVKINYNKLDKVIDDIKLSNIKFWLNTNPFNILSLDYKSIINFLAYYHAIGDYCFWGNPKWKINTPDGILDGSYAMMYILIERIKNNKSLDLKYEEFKEMVKANVEIPLLDDRYNNLVELNNFLKSNGCDFYSLVSKFNKDEDLFEYIINNLSYYNDEAIYDNNIVYFYKRAQLLTSDILHVREILEHINVDYSNLVGCADYKIPQVLRCYGILEFDDELSYLVDNEIPLKKGSVEEIEIRACDIVVIDYIAKKIDNKITRIDINDYIWLLGQNKKLMKKPYHRTLTSKY